MSDWLLVRGCFLEDFLSMEAWEGCMAGLWLQSSLRLLSLKLVGFSHHLPRTTLRNPGAFLLVNNSFHPVLHIDVLSV